MKIHVLRFTVLLVICMLSFPILNFGQISGPGPVTYCPGTVAPTMQFPMNYPVNSDGFYTFCVDEPQSSMIGLPNPAPNGNLPDDEYLIELSGVDTILISSDGTFDPTSFNLQAGDTMYLTSLTYDLDSIDGILFVANTLCPLLDITQPDALPCSAQPLNIPILVGGYNDGVVGLNSLAEVMAFASVLSNTPFYSMDTLLASLLGINDAISGIAGGMSICFGMSESVAVVGVSCAIPGCTDMTACNFDMTATEDDGTCTFPGDACDDGNAATINDIYQSDCTCLGDIEGCTDMTACNFDPNATLDDGSCLSLDCLGNCGGPALVGSACDDGDVNTINDVYMADCSCAGVFNTVLGCTDMAACNFDPLANTDDGSCLTLDCLGDCGGPALVGTSCDDGDASTENDVYNANCTCIGAFIAVNGCTDANACNFDAAANTDDGSCIYLNIDNSPFPTAVTYVCSGESIDVSAITPTFANATNICYYLHSDAADIANSTVMMSTSGVFANTGNNTNQTLYVSAAGDTGTLNCPDVTQGCTEVFHMTTIGFVNPVVVTSEVDCPELVGDFNVTFSVSGGTPDFPNSTDLFTYSGSQSGMTGANTLTAIGPINDGSVYTITATDPQGCTTTFESELIECNKLPIELIDFSGKAKESGNELSWITATEIENEYFTLAKFDADNNSFEELVKIEGAGTSSQQNNYTFLDNKITGLTSLYKLGQTDFNGNTVEIGIVEIANKAYSFQLQEIHPNPINDYVVISYNSKVGTNIEVSLYNSNGSLVYLESFNNTSVENRLEINTQAFPIGLYTIAIKSENQLVTQKLIKN